VKESFRTAGEAQRTSPTAAALATEEVTTDRTPGGEEIAQKRFSLIRG